MDKFLEKWQNYFASKYNAEAFKGVLSWVLGLGDMSALESAKGVSQADVDAFKKELQDTAFPLYGRKPLINEVCKRYGLSVSNVFAEETMNSSGSFDGSDKGNQGHSPNILYHLENLNTEFGQKLRDEVLDSASDEAKAFFNDCDYDPVRVVDCADLSEDEWHARRRASIGASEVATIMGTSPFANNVDTWNEKVGNKPVNPDNPTEAYSREAMFLWGHIAEEYLRTKILDKKLFPQFEGCEIIVETETFSHEKYPFLTCNLDAIMKWPDGHFSIIEFKAPNIHTKDHYENNAVPEYYGEQMQEQMFLTNIDDAYLIALFSRDDITVSRMVRDLDAEMEIVQNCAEFWTGSVMAEIEPEPNGSGESLIKTSRRYKGKGINNTPPIMLDPAEAASALAEADELRNQRTALMAQVKILDKKFDDAIAPVLYTMGQNVKAICVDPANNCKYEVTYKEVADSAKMTKASLERVEATNPALYNAILPYITYSGGYRSPKIKKVIG